MRMSSFIVAAAVVPSTALAQQSNIPIVDLPTPAVRTAERLGAVLGLRQGVDGKVLVNDALRRQMLLFDTLLTTRAIVMDSVEGTSTSYGPAPVPLSAYVGDSSLFVDVKSRTVVVVDGHGRIARTIALPRPQDLTALVGARSGVDAKGRVVVQGGRPENSREAVGSAALPMDVRDSLPILRIDLDARRVDTIAQLARPVMKLTSQRSSAGTVTAIYAVDPLQAVDDWTVLSNGSVAIVRGHDYHIDWIDPDGSMRTSAKTPFDWKRLSDADKQRLSDSLRVAQDSSLKAGYKNAEFSVQGPMPCGAPDGGRGRAPDDGGGARSGRGGGGGGAPPPASPGGCYQRLKSVLAMVGPATWLLPPAPPLADVHRANPISDYAPPIQMNATISDLDDNLWILPRVSTLSRRGELIYDVVNAKGELFERVRVPLGRAIAGFAKGGVVYLTFGDMKTGFYLERTQLPGSR